MKSIDILFQLKGVELDSYGNVLQIRRTASWAAFVFPVLRRWPFQESDRSYRNRILKALLEEQAGQENP